MSLTYIHCCILLFFLFTYGGDCRDPNNPEIPESCQLPSEGGGGGGGGSSTFGVFIESSNAGQTWSSIDSLGFAKALYCGYLGLSPNVFIIAGQDTANRPTIWRSTDYGYTWSSALTLINPGGAFKCITHTTNHANLAAVTTAGHIYVSHNDGATWAVQNSATPPPLHAIDFFEGGNVGVAVGENGRILRSSDGGSNWTPVTSGTSQHLYAVHCIDGLSSDTVVAVGGGGTIVRSVDAGLTWNVTTIPRIVLLKAVSFSASSTGRYGIVVGDVRTIYKTTNNGDTWQEMYYSPGNGGHTDVVVSSDGAKAYTIWTKTSSSTPPQSYVYRSTDRGETWHSAMVGPSQNIYAAYLYKLIFRDVFLTAYVFAVGVPN